MGDSSKWKPSQNLEWTTELPYEGIHRMSPAFVIRGIEHHFILFRDGHYFKVALKLIDEPSRSRFRSFSVTARVDFKRGSSTYLVYGPSTETCELWQICFRIDKSTIASKVENDLLHCNMMRFLFTFDNADRLQLPVLEVKTGEKSTQADMGLVQPDLEFLSIDFGCLLDDEIHPDIRIRCKDGVVQAHRAVLSARSRVFAAMFRTDMKEKETGVVDMQHMDLETLRLLLKFIYRGKIPDFPVEMASTLYPLGDKYEISALKKMCADFLARNVSKENYTEYLSLADAHGDDTFKEAVTSYVVDNPELMKNERWLKFSAEHAKVALEVTLKYINDLPPKK